MVVTVKDIAKAAGLSPGTVSRALNNRKEVKPETIVAIRSLAQTMGYRPNRASKALFANKSLVKIGVMIPVINSPFFEDIRSGMLNAASEYEDLGLELAFFPFEGWNADEHVKTMDQARQEGCRAVCLCTLPDPKVAAKIRELKEQGCSIIFVNHRLKGIEDDLFFVGPDFFKSGFLAANMAAMCCKDPLNILVVIGYKFLEGHIERLEGFKHGLSTLKVDYDDLKIVEGEDNDIQSQMVTMEALAKDPRINCIYIATGSGSPGACRAVMTKPCNKPFVICTDELPLARECTARGIVDVLICQDPVYQGYMTVTKAYRQLTSNYFDEESDLIIEPLVKIRGHYLKEGE